MGTGLGLQFSSVMAQSHDNEALENLVCTTMGAVARFALI
jgi:hypothetical protein